MTTKPVKFELCAWVTKFGDTKTLENHVRGVFMRTNTKDAILVASTAEEARNVAAKINEWADAKEASERVTFGDLAVREWFCVRQNISLPCCKITEHRYVSPYVDADVCPDPDTPVIRLRATFEEVEP